MPMDAVQEGRINRRSTTQSRRRRLPSHAANINLQNALSSVIEAEGSNTVPPASNTPQLPPQNTPAAAPPTEQDGQTTQTSATTSLSTMTPQERAWWAMSFEEVYQLAKSHGFGKGREGRKSGRVRIIKWLCEAADITPYVAPTIDPAASETSSHIIRTRPVRSTGAISHPEAILRTADPDLQRKIKEREGHYSGWKHADLTAEAMRRSYQLLKDSEGKLPSRSVKALVAWLAAWDVLKSEREKRWWLGDGIDLVNKAKAIGYSGNSTKKYDVILWLRLTPDDCEVGLEEIKEPTPNKGPSKRRGVGEVVVVETVSKRRAKGSTRS